MMLIMIGLPAHIPQFGTGARGRRTLAAGFLLAFLLVLAPSSLRAQESPLVRVKDLGQHLQQVVTVQGRTGYIAERYEKHGFHVFTLRDDYNDQILIRTMANDYPVMGITYRVTGWAVVENGVLFIDTLPGHILPAYPAAPPKTALPAGPLALLWLAGGLVALAALAGLVLAVRHLLGRSLPEWGELTVASGPDKGRTLSLRRHRIPLGRGVSAARGIRLSAGDSTISNLHVTFTYRNGALFCTDTSRNGTRIGGERLQMGVPTRINSGDLIHLGTQGTVIIIRLRELAPTSGFLTNLMEPSPVSDQTMMFPEQAPDEPGWGDHSIEAPEDDAEGTRHISDMEPEEAEQPAGDDAPADDKFSFIALPPRKRHTSNGNEPAATPQPWQEEEVA